MSIIENRKDYFMTAIAQQNSCPLTPENGAIAMESQLQEAEELTQELKRLLVRSESALEQEGIKEQVETLEGWMESYRRGLKAATKLAENGTTLLEQVRERLKLAADELQRLESEGGQPATKEQATQAEEFIRATQRIDKVLPSVEQLFNPKEPETH